MKQEARREKGIWEKCVFVLLGFVFLAAGCARVQTEPQPASASAAASRMQTAAEEAPAASIAAVEGPSPKRTESAQINGLEVKEKPRKKSRTIAVLSKGDPVEIKGESGKWVNVLTQAGQDGWVDSSGLTGFAETPKTQAPAAVRTPVKARQPVPAAKPTAGPAKSDSPPRVSDATPAPPRVSDSDVPAKAPISDADEKPRVSDSE